MYCSKCGNEVVEGTAFCPKCGQEISGKPKSEGALAGIAKTASDVKKKAAEKIGALNEKINDVDENEAEEKKREINQSISDDKNWNSISEIIAQKKGCIFKLQGAKNALLGSTSFKMRSEISESKAKSLSKKVAQGKIQANDIIAVYDNKNEGKIVFTDYAMYATEKMMLPIVVKYSDITEVGTDKENTEKAIVRLSNGLEWTITNNNYIDMKALSEIIATLSDFSKKRGEDEKSKGVISSAEQEATSFLKLIAFVFITAIFSWNCYAIVHNFSIRTGYLWAIIGIIVNIVILYPLAGTAAAFVGMITRKPEIEEKLVAKKIIWAFPVILFLFFGIVIGHVPYKQHLADLAAPTVSQILKNAYGDYMDVAKCTKVDNVYKIADHIYKGTAYLDNGNTLQISISDADKGNIYVEIDSY